MQDEIDEIEIKEPAIPEEPKRKAGHPKGNKNCTHCGKPRSKCKCGRPTKQTSKTVEKLKHAFLYGASIGEACMYADISPDTYARMIKKNPSFAEMVDTWRERPMMLARRTIVGRLTASPEDAWKYAESHKPDEFKPLRGAPAGDGKQIHVIISDLGDGHTNNPTT